MFVMVHEQEGDLARYLNVAIMCNLVAGYWDLASMQNVCNLMSMLHHDMGGVLL